MNVNRPESQDERHRVKVQIAKGPTRTLGRQRKGPELWPTTRILRLFTLHNKTESNIFKPLSLREQKCNPFQKDHNLNQQEH